MCRSSIRRHILCGFFVHFSAQAERGCVAASLVSHSYSYVGLTFRDSSPKPMRQIDRLLKYAGTDRKLHKSVWHNGQDWSFYMKPLTIAEQQRATKNSRTDDPTDFALHLLCDKAEDENGQKQFVAASDLPVMRNTIEKACLDKLMLAIIQQDEEAEEEQLDMKSSDEGASKGKRANSRASGGKGVGEDVG